jgi:ABC-type lipoprotein release transport system permease subunit
MTADADVPLIVITGTSLLFTLSPFDPLSYASAAVVLTTAALLASFLPARRATHVDPVNALRAE